MSTPHPSGETDALPAEFGFIGRIFRPLAGEGALDLRDDAAVLTPPAGRQMVMAVDAMVEGVHFLPDDPADTVGRKLLRCNLSDLAAMDATPLGYLLTVARPRHVAEGWFTSFAAGLHADQETYGLGLLGGDTTSTTGPLVLSLTIVGHVAPGCALRRTTARVGDGLWVTGTIGDGALGLLALRGQVPDPGHVLATRYRLPCPRLGLGLHGIASAAMDVSDGLVQDAGHLARESGVGVVIEVDRVPLSDAARAAGPQWRETCLTGGDDYELLLAVPPEHEQALLARGRHHGVRMTRIGRFVDPAGGAGVRLRDAQGAEVKVARTGWSHL
ncbi:thiamine-phosphate kinase [Gluconacetobacter entanii]|uniref:thiamine-phosphate kinase n=1 Tax=Gluconacetobacter entanii TaxID=108528 RepID=UPI00187B9CD0|nr:thiamine-phosphate kinase [Gluconacetobacter entanii]MBE7619968.1 thiamine-phosphate kinase [Komagataeibacter sp. FXV2]MBY4640272.1 thiamine-phosphate kinase [Gluconacetobacter entanii]MCW4582219.1 thiamine-phosphate kinase [Gluconacetobacter entanii]MCW4585422.1 thiamine-phosphate kinase [Gluconacetobacter entanii]MCW4588617.1 thiamine-phosphate kinase [Gluconacetobacter entanii]